MGSSATAPGKSRLPLADFADNWVGGDIHGLAAFASTLYRYVPDLDDVVAALNRQVSRVTDDASWQGAAAQAFGGNWDKVAAQLSAVGQVVAQTAGIVDQLAADLAAIENALENAAGKAAAHGVQLGAAGQPPDVCYSNPVQESWRAAYSTYYQQCLADANEARAQAAGALVTLTSATTSGSRGRSGRLSQAAGGAPSDVGVRVGEGNTIADLVADLLATPTTYSRTVADKVEEASAKLAKAQAEWDDAQRAARQANGQYGDMPEGVKVALFESKHEVVSVGADLTKAQAGENAISKLLGTRLNDLPAPSGIPRQFRTAGLISKASDLPVVDVLAGGISTVLNAQADVHAGVPGWAAYPLETANTAGSLALAAVTAGAIGGAAVFAGAPMLGVAAGVAAGGVIAYGVGDYVHNLIADMPQQWDQHGALGIVTDFGAAGVSTWDDTSHLGSDVGHLANGAWHLAKSWL